MKFFSKHPAKYIILSFCNRPSDAGDRFLFKAGGRFAVEHAERCVVQISYHKNAFAVPQIKKRPNPVTARCAAGKYRSDPRLMPPHGTCLAGGRPCRTSRNSQTPTFQTAIPFQGFLSSAAETDPVSCTEQIFFPWRHRLQKPHASRVTGFLKKAFFKAFQRKKQRNLV